MLTIFLSREHTDFSESTEEIAPLTEDEKKAKLDELRDRLKAKRAAQSVQDKEEQKRNEVCGLLVDCSAGIDTDKVQENPPKVDQGKPGGKGGATA